MTSGTAVCSQQTDSCLHCNATQFHWTYCRRIDHRVGVLQQHNQFVCTLRLQS